MSKCSGTEYIQELITKALAIEAKEAQEVGALGYMAKIFTQASLPYKSILGNEYKRSNGIMKLSILSPSDIGIPYGSYPRLLLSWLTTEAVKTQNHVLELGSSLNHFMNELGLESSGGRWGTIPRLRDQILRLFCSIFSCTYQDEFRDAGLTIQIAKSYDLWWNAKSPAQAALWQSTVTLSKDFFDEIINRPVPIDLRVLKAIKQSAMKLDIYCWLTHRMSYLRHKTEIPWEALQLQFGSTLGRTRDFKEAFLYHLKGVLLFYSAKVETGEYGLVLKPSKTHIKQQERPIFITQS